MSERKQCPWPEFASSWIDLPDKWLGEHAARRDEARAKAIEAELPVTFIEFSIGMALLDDWDLPGLTGNPEKWDFNELDLPLIAWVIQETLISFGQCWAVPKVLSSPSQNGSTAKEAAKASGPITATE